MVITTLYTMHNKSVEELEKKITSRLENLDKEVRLLEALCISTRNPPALVENKIIASQMTAIVAACHSAVCTDPVNGCPYCWNPNSPVGDRIRSRAKFLADCAATFNISIKLASKYELAFKRIYLNEE